jgi:3-phenylpropionate/trans-cinnamate dioxygenase ferredoxin reductase subunit
LNGIVIVGAGQAGARAATALREAGYTSRIRLIGDEPEPPYERPALSKGVLTGAQTPESTWVFPADHYAGHDIELTAPLTAVALAPSAQQVFLSDGSAIGYDKLLITTGSRVRPLPGAPEGLEGVFYLRSMADSRALAPELAEGRRVVVIGGGYMGLEIAASARGRGCSVTIVEREPHLLARVMPRGVADAIAAVHRSADVDVRVGAALARLDGDRHVSNVVLADGTELPADVVVIAIGVIPNTELAESAGAQSSDGLVVDEFGRTTLANVYAAGDVANQPCRWAGRRIRLESWQNAQNQAMTVARNMVSAELTAYQELPWFWSDQYDLNIQMFGIASTDAAIVWRGEPGTPRSLAFAIENGRVTMAVAFNAAADLRQAKRLIETGAPVDAALLQDAARRMKDLVKDLSGAVGAGSLALGAA